MEMPPPVAFDGAQVLPPWLARRVGLGKGDHRIMYYLAGIFSSFAIFIEKKFNPLDNI